jgi:drug/metabolite transporter (DMT)-like permease
MLQCGAASLGFLLNMLAFAVINLTGSLTQKILGTVKNILLVFWSVIIMGETITSRQWIGYNVSLLGFAWYQNQKIRGSMPSQGSSQGGLVAKSSSREFGVSPIKSPRSNGLEHRLRGPAVSV